MNKKILIPTIALLAALLIAPAMAARADTVVIGGGWIIDEAGNHANFAFNVDSNLKGQVKYSVSGEWHMSSTGITGFRHREDGGGPTWVEIRGTCRVTYLSTGLTEDDVFQLEVEDIGEPGGEDHPEGNLGDWIIMYVGGEGAGTEYWYCSWEGAGPGPPTGQHIDGGNIQHLGLEGPFIP